MSDIQELLPASQANISQHLTVLRHAGIMNFAQDGSQRGFSGFAYRQTLGLGESTVPTVREGHGSGGFLVMRARKNA